MYMIFMLSPDTVVLHRFIRGKVSFADQSEREAPPKGSGVVNLLYGSKPLRDAFSSVASLYESFVGPLHFHVMSHLLGYQGIAMILEQLLHIVEGQVRGWGSMYMYVHPIYMCTHTHIGRCYGVYPNPWSSTVEPLIKDTE